MLLILGIEVEVLQSCSCANGFVTDDNLTDKDSDSAETLPVRVEICISDIDKPVSTTSGPTQIES